MSDNERVGEGGTLNAEQRAAIQHIKDEFPHGYYLVLLPGGRFGDEPATHIVISKEQFGDLAEKARRA